MDNQYPYNNESLSEWNQITESDNPERKRIMNIGVKTLALVGGIALLSLSVWGTVQLARVAPGNLLAAVSNITSVFIPAGEDEEITFNLQTHNVTAGEAFTLDWVHEPRESGSYTFRYECREGVSFETETKSGSTRILCDTPFDLDTNDTSFVFTADSTKNRFVDVPVTIAFIPGTIEGATLQGSTLLTIVNTKLNGSTIGNGTNTPDTTTPSGNGSITRGPEDREVQVIGGNGSTGNGGSTGVGISNPQGTPDLAVTVLATGVSDKISNVFTPGATVTQNDRAAIRFEVRNVGTKASGAWSFIIDLPLSGRMFVYRPNEVQQSLNPGERIEYTLGFDEIDRSGSTTEAIINVDSARVVPEVNRANNSATALLNVESN